MKKKRLSTDKIKHAVFLYKSGMTLREIGKIMDRHHDSIYELLKKEGVKFRPMPQKSLVHPWFRGGSFHDEEASYKVGLALKSGLLIRPNNCSKCGIKNKKTRNGKSYIQAHHCDYNKPLVVTWLCKSCHHHWHEHNKAIPKKAY